MAYPDTPYYFRRRQSCCSKVMGQDRFDGTTDPWSVLTGSGVLQITRIALLVPA